MATINGIGFSDATPQKYENFKSVIQPYLLIYDKILGKHRKYSNWMDNKFHYFDITSGNGRNPKTGDMGSPLLFIEEAIKYKNKFKLHLIEQNIENCESLINDICNTFKSPPNIECVIINGNSVDILPSFFIGKKKKRFGLVFADPNGVKLDKGITPFDLLRDMSDCGCYSHTDYLINCNSTQIKRNRGVKTVAGFEKYDKDLNGYMKDVGKKYWCLTEPRGNANWTMILATNWWELIKKMKSSGFYWNKSKKGQEILNKIN